MALTSKAPKLTWSARTRASLCFAGLFGSTAIWLTVPAHADVAPVFNFAVNGLTDPRMVGARWVLQTQTGSGWSVVSHGIVPTGDSFAIQLPLQTVAATVDNGFALLLTQPEDDTHMLVGVGMEARPADQVAAGGTITFNPVVLEAPARKHAFGTPPIPEDETLLNDGPTSPTMFGSTGGSSPSSSTPSAAQAPTPSCTLSCPSTDSSSLWTPDDPCGIDLSQQSLPPNCPVPGVPLPEPWGPGDGNPYEALPVPTTPSPPQAFLPNSVNCLISGCDPTANVATQDTSNPQPQADGQCSSDTTWWSGTSEKDCTTASSQTNLDTFRGWSNRVPGDAVQPSEDYSYTETLDIGYRVQAGPFSISGGKDSEYTSGGTINFAFRGDCWNPPQPGDNCSSFGGYGWWSHWGQDLWRWEHHTIDHCDVSDCYSSDYELVWDVANSGGNDTSQQNALNGEGERPLDVKNGADGAAGHWNPDTGTQTKYLETSTKYSFAASFELSWNKAFGGSVKFDASASDKTYRKFYNAITLRGPNTGLPWMGGWYDYDGNYTPHWGWDFWTCYYRPGWSGGAMAQSDAITSTYPCWDYTAAGSPPLS